MFAATLVMFTGAAIIWLLDIIGVIQSVHDVLILTDNQLLESKFSKSDQETDIFNTIQFICQAVIVCYFQYSDIKR